MSNDPSSLSLDAAITAYLRSEYFAGLSPLTRSKRRGVLRNMRAEVQRLSAAEISEAEISAAPARNEIPSETPARSVPWRPVHRRRNWTTA
jgi:hypothetical protein